MLRSGALSESVKEIKILIKYSVGWNSLAFSTIKYKIPTSVTLKMTENAMLFRAMHYSPTLQS